MLIRPATSTADLDAVYRLTHDAYIALGYCAPQPDGRLRHYTDIDTAPENMVVVVEEAGAIVGTVSITLDGPAGLPSEQRFGGAVDAIRAEGTVIGACWRLVTEPGHRATDAVLIELMRSTVTVFSGFGVDTALLSLAPRHERAYNRIFGTVTIARTSDAAGAAVSSPLVLVRGSVAAGIRRLPPDDNPALATLVAERRRLIAAVRDVAA